MWLKVEQPGEKSVHLIIFEYSGRFSDDCIDELKVAQLTNLQRNARHRVRKSIGAAKPRQLCVIYGLLSALCPLQGYILCVSDFVFVRYNLDQILKPVNQHEDL